MFALTFFATTYAAKYNVWQLDEPKVFDLKLDADMINRRLNKAMTKQLVNNKQLNDALHKTNCSAEVEKHHVSMAGSKRCWSYNSWDATPHGCPSSGWVKYDKFEFVQAKVHSAGVSVDENNHYGLTVANVTFNIKPTAFTAQPHGLFTMPCTGILTGLIEGATNAVEAAVNLTSEGVPVIGEAAAAPVDGVVVKIEKSLTGLCKVLVDLIEDILDLVAGLLKGIIQEVLPPIIKELLEGILKLALGVIDTAETKMLAA